MIEAGAKARLSVAIAYAAAIGMAVMLFELRSGLSEFTLRFVPYMTAVAGAGIFGSSFTSWYQYRTGVFEILAVPFIVGSLSIITAGQAFAFVAALISGSRSVEVLSTVAGGLYASFLFVWVVWPFILLALLSASLAVFAVLRRASGAHAA